MEKQTTIFRNFFDSFNDSKTRVQNNDMTLYCKLEKQPSYDVYFSKSFTKKNGFLPGDKLYLGINLANKFIGISKNDFPAAIPIKVNSNGAPRFGNKDVVFKLIEALGLSFGDTKKLIKTFKLLEQPSVFNGISIFKIQE